MIMMMMILRLGTKVDPLLLSLLQPGSNKSIEMRMVLMLMLITKNESESKSNYHHDKGGQKGQSQYLYQNKLMKTKFQLWIFTNIIDLPQVDK